MFLQGHLKVAEFQRRGVRMPSVALRLWSRLDALRPLARRVARRFIACRGLRTGLRAASYAGLLPGSLWRRLPVDLTFEVAVPNAQAFLYRASPNDAIGRSLYWRGLQGYEPETVRPFLDLARAAQVILDVGANTGVFTLLASAVNPAARVIAFEPLPRLGNALRENVNLNGWNDRIQVFGEAVTDQVGAAPFHVPRADVPTSASLNRNGFRGLEGDIILVPTTTLDASIDDETHIDLVKIDVEGFEDRVLRGMTRILSRWRPAIIVECNPDGPQRELEQVLSDRSYVFYHLGPRGPELRPHLLPDQTERCRNYLCLPVERVGLEAPTRKTSINTVSR